MKSTYSLRAEAGQSRTGCIHTDGGLRLEEEGGMNGSNEGQGNSADVERYYWNEELEE